MLGIILVVFLILFLVGGVAPWGNYPGPNHGYGYGGGLNGGVGIIVIVVIVLLVMGRI